MRRVLRQLQQVAANPTVGAGVSTDLKGDVAIVTGGAGAIGSATAERLLRNGASVCICDQGGVSILGIPHHFGASVYAPTFGPAVRQKALGRLPKNYP